MSERKINAWHKAGIIDDATRDNILAFEAEHARPLALWAVFGIGALAIGLGLISVVAANWEDIPGQLRLAVHMALIAASLGGLLFQERLFRAQSPWIGEALLFVAGLLGLTFFGHLGQVYQTTSPLWQPLAIWLVLFAPLLLTTGRSWLTAALFGVALVYCAWEYAYWLEFPSWRDQIENPPTLWIAAVTALPLLLVAPPAAWFRQRSTRADFWRRLEQLAVVYAVGGASIATGLAGVDAFDDGASAFFSGAGQVVRSLIALAAGLLVVLARRNMSGLMSGAIIAGAGAAAIMSYAVSGYQLLAGLVFMALWAGIGAAALVAGWRGVFQLAVAAIAIRLIILSFELASDLLLSGFGLIVSGLLIVGIAWIAYRVSSAFAPVSDEADGLEEGADA